MNFIQQGDFLFIPGIINVPKKMEQIKDPILGSGETGHCHKLTAGEWEIYQYPKTKERWLRVVQPSTISHEEHKPVNLPLGDYRIERVREKGMFDDLIAPVVD